MGMYPDFLFEHIVFVSLGPLVVIVAVREEAVGVLQSNSSQ